MRLLFLLLLLANLLLLAWIQGYLTPITGIQEADRLQDQLVPEKLRIVNPGSVPAQLSCQRIEWLKNADAETLHKKLAAETGWALKSDPFRLPAQYRVLIPELANRALAEKKQVELRRLGVSEGQIEGDAPQGAVSLLLGNFQEQAAADDYLQSITRKGVRSARVAVHHPVSDKTALEVRGPTTELAAKLPVALLGLPAITSRPCAGP